MRRARRAEAGLTEEVGRRWGGGEWPAQRRSDGGRLRRSVDVLGGGPAARGGGEGDCGSGVKAKKKNMTHGGIRPTTTRFPIKVGRRERGRGGPRRDGKRLERPASAPGRRALPHYSAG
jgi:hypothetical protein